MYTLRSSPSAATAASNMFTALVFPDPSTSTTTGTAHSAFDTSNKHTISFIIQIFGGPAKSKARDHKISSRATFTDLSTKLRRITGLTKLIIIINGLRIDLEKQPSQTVDVLFGQRLLVVKIIGEECPKEEGKAEDSIEHSEPFRLLDLPPEIRDMITTLVVTKLKSSFYQAYTIPVPSRYEPALSMTCRQMRNEAIGIYYRENRFRVCLDDFYFIPLFTWLKAIGVEHSHAIRHLFIDLKGEEGWANARHYLQTKEAMLPSTSVKFFGDNFYMDDAWDHAIEMGTGLREAGLSWDQIETALGHSTHIMDLAGFWGGMWPDDSALQAEIDADIEREDAEVARAEKLGAGPIQGSRGNPL